MLPPITAIKSIEMIRDGGSLSASFMGDNGSTYCLHLQLLSEWNPAGDFVRLGYAKPVVFERVCFRSLDRTEWQALNEVEVSWEHAKVLLHQLRGHLQAERDVEWLGAMEESVNSAGGLPACVAPIAQRSR